MPRDPRKREKSIMKRRRQQKESAKARHRQQANALDTPRAVLRRARSFPVYECLISSNWSHPEQAELVQILLARRQPDGDIIFGVYLVDPMCLGLKNTFYRTHYSPAEYEDEEEIKAILAAETPLEACPLELAHQMIYGAIAYAARFGFQPNRDWADTQLLLEPRGKLPETYDLTFGRDGKPFFVSGPYDNVPLILSRLQRNPGPGNYDYIVGLDDADVAGLDLADGTVIDADDVEEDEYDDEEDDLSRLDFVEADPDEPPR